MRGGPIGVALVGEEQSDWQGRAGQDRAGQGRDTPTEERLPAQH